MIPFVDLKAQYLTIKDEIDAAIRDVVESCHFILGEQVEAFEADFARFCGTEYALGVNSGTSALHLALLAAGVKAGDEVITVSDTFVATAAAICYTGAKPVFVEIDPRSCTMDPAKIEAAITPRTRVLMPVHLYGGCADMDPITEIAIKYQLIVIEDAAQAHGAEYKGRRAGSLSDIACFSFYPGKNLGAYGEGGAVVTDNAEYAAAIKRLRDHGQSEKYYHDEVGYNYRMEGIQGAVLRVKLRHLENWTAARRRHAATYRESLAGSGVRLLEPHGSSAWHIFPVFLPRRDELLDNLKARKIASGIHYPIPVHLQRGYAELGYKQGDLPLTEQACNEVLSLPMYAELPNEHLLEVATAIQEFTANTFEPTAEAEPTVEATRAHS
ncbi:MAG TPA: DegT/DnrJ/EryC1/StrS family aminotransferase [Pyrinomonadaceae bacterium]|nr:DegT/DnrJ/EryC1/StrS family aminotransferase [Pyrinomonadaceae bacterium]